MMNEKVEEVGVFRPEVQGSEDRGGSPFEGDDVLYDDSASREALEAYAVSRGVASPEQYPSKKELRRALHRIVVANECAAARSEDSATAASPVRSAAQPAAPSVAAVQLEADQVSQPNIEAALERYTQIISDNDFPGIAVALNAAPRHQLERMVDMLLSDEDPAAIEAFKKALGIASVNAHLFAAEEATEWQAECAQNEPWVHCLASRHFSRRPIAVKEAFGNLSSLTSALCKWMADSLFAGRHGVLHGYSLRALARGYLGGVLSSS